MGQCDILKIQTRTKDHVPATDKVEYVSGKQSGLQPRGNVQLGEEKYLLSLKPNWFHKLLFRLFF